MLHAGQHDLESSGSFRVERGNGPLVAGGPLILLRNSISSRQEFFDLQNSTAQAHRRTARPASYALRLAPLARSGPAHLRGRGPAGGLRILRDGASPAKPPTGG